MRLLFYKGKKMARKIALSIDERLYTKLEKHAHKNGESVQDFLIQAVCDALDMWDDFYDSTDNLETQEPRPKVTFFVNS